MGRWYKIRFQTCLGTGLTSVSKPSTHRHCGAFWWLLNASPCSLRDPGPEPASWLPASLRPHKLKPPGSSVHEISQKRILEWLPCSPPGNLPNPGIKPMSLVSPELAGRVLPNCTTWEALPAKLNSNTCWYWCNKPDVT